MKHMLLKTVLLVSLVGFSYLPLLADADNGSAQLVVSTVDQFVVLNGKLCLFTYCA